MVVFAFVFVVDDDGLSLRTLFSLTQCGWFILHCCIVEGIDGDGCDDEANVGVIPTAIRATNRYSIIIGNVVLFEIILMIC